MTNHGRDKMTAADDGKGGVLGGGSRRWEDLSRDLLTGIFSRIGVEDLIAGVPYVCSSWYYAAREPICWRNLDFQRWYAISQRLECWRDDGSVFDDLIEFVITRSEKTIDSFHFPIFADQADLEYLAIRCPELRYFSLKFYIVSVPSVAQFCSAISRLKYLTGMAVDQSLISHQVLQHVNQCCNKFKELKVFSHVMDRKMASTICKCLPRLQKLEITNCKMSNNIILTLLDGLKEIEFLDISECLLFGITSEVIEKASLLKVFKWDSTHDLGEFEYCSDCEEDFFSQMSCRCMMD